MSEKKREQGDQIREALAALPTLKVAEDVYLKLENVLDATEDILYPEGLKTQEEYNRLVKISKAGCRTLGYNDEEVSLLPPVIDFRQRGTYLKKMPVIADEVIAMLINELAKNACEIISSPYIAITRKRVTSALAYHQFKKPWETLSLDMQQKGISHCDKVARSLGYKLRHFDDDPAWPAGEVGYAKVMVPNMDACQAAITDFISYRSNFDLSDLMKAGLRAAFMWRVKQDPESVITEQVWCDLFDELGYVYDAAEHELTPKPLNLPDNIQELLVSAILGMSTYSHPKIGRILIKDELIKVAKDTLGEGITKSRLEGLITDGLIGRVMVQLGYKIETIWFSRYDFMEAKIPLSDRLGAEVFAPAIHVSNQMQTPAFADGFRIHSPVLVRDERTLVYMELLGPRQAVKANWAALRQKNRNHYLKGVLSINKEDQLTTLKSTLPCGWDQWCMIHRQASYYKMIPNETFYLIDHNPKQKGPPSTFIAFLAKSLAIPILPQWAEHLWVEGRMKKLITPLSESCYGYGGWKVEAHEWDKVVSDGLGEKKISF